ncbi:FtsW/RodA/SpoVE family cell cycle protein [Phaeocystidibacter marisrubri]|uniref:Probable peptidoglycan glycosyltransferase FtsW n=1 Tax=Phaeocystidibacter marisrubri TaxID=1577780 RepID=A0A6L3ZG54_9FLAO|nr:FtsW/RodA/SpoVE family cell cycle protein [Phaeocystidibacter marisrubri]KAB2816834.1 cell division protein FtsW [Phaeocystidibacter marisrubri]GGH77949.1 cell division protein FtsW [Phaeocystidibacter marisrubri]
MNRVLKYFEGDRTTWVIVFLLALFSFMPVYSASSNLAFRYGDGNVISMLVKHAVHMGLGIALMYLVHRVQYRYFAPLSLLIFPLIAGLLLFTLVNGHEVANASRWVRIPIVNVTFQPSALASIVLITYLARFMAKYGDNFKSFRDTWLKGLLPIGIICGLIFPANVSTAAIIFTLSMIVLFVGGFPLKYILNIFMIGVASLGLFILTVTAFPGISNRLDTAVTRLSSFWSGDEEANYQVEHAKMAIARGGIVGQGPGKSGQKNFLSQSESDFIYAIVNEEFGLIGGFLISMGYVWLFFRIIRISMKAEDKFGRLLAFGIGTGIIFQAFINMGVAVNLLPVTGQPLPLISSGGSSLWMTCIALGMVQSVARGLTPSAEIVDETKMYNDNIPADAYA